MIEQVFKPGDVVELRSGGPKMTVRNYEPQDSAEVTCEWFDKSHSLCTKSFHQDTLRTYNSPYVSGVHVSSIRRSH